MSSALFAFQLAFPRADAPERLASLASRLAERPARELADQTNLSNRSLFEALRTHLPHATFGGWRWERDPTAADATWRTLCATAVPSDLPPPLPDEPSWSIVTFAALVAAGTRASGMLLALTGVADEDAAKRSTFDRFLRELHKLDWHGVRGHALFVRPRDAHAPGAPTAELDRLALAPLDRLTG